MNRKLWVLTLELCHRHQYWQEWRTWLCSFLGEMHDSHGVLPADDKVRGLTVMLIDRKVDRGLKQREQGGPELHRQRNSLLLHQEDCNSSETEMGRHVRRLLQRTQWLKQRDMGTGLIQFRMQTKAGGRLPANEIQSANMRRGGWGWPKNLVQTYRMDSS